MAPKSPKKEERVPSETNRERASKPKFDWFLATDGASDYEVFKERVELYYENNEISSGRRSGIFLEAISTCVYKLIRDRIHPEVPKSKSLEEIFQVLDSHFVEKINIRASRYTFNRIKQESGESLAEFLARIREAASDCDFGDFLKEQGLNTGLLLKLRVAAIEDRVLDRFVMGVANDHIQQVLLEENPQTIAIAFDKARTIQMAQDQSGNQVNAVQQKFNRNQSGLPGRKAIAEQPRNLSGPPGRKAPIAGDTKEDTKGDANGGDTKESCFRCGKSRHHINECPARLVTCYRCGKRGHFQQWCRAGGYVNTIDEVDRNPVHIVLEINNRKIKFQIDCGSCANIIDYELFKSIVMNEELKPILSTLRTYSGERLNVVGHIGFQVVHDNQAARVEFLIHRGKRGDPLLGRPGLDVLFPNWRSIFRDTSKNQHNIKDTICEIQSDLLEMLKSKFPKVFDGNIGESIEQFKADIILEDNHRKIVAKPYNLPFGLRDAVEAELHRLVKEGILEPVITTSYASPMVVVAKKDGK